MKFIRLLILLLRRGSIAHKPFDFEANRQKNIDASYFPTNKKVKTKSRLKQYLLNTRVGYGILSNLAYIKNVSDMNKMYYVSDEKKLTYIRILKSGSTSVLKVFLPLIEPNVKDIDFKEDQIDTLGYYYAKKSLSPQQGEYKKFAIVRDPFRRIVSVYLDLFDPTAPTFTYATYWFGVLRQDMTFKDFVKTISNIPQALAGPHVASQTSILNAADKLRHISIMKIEDIETVENFFAEHGMSMLHMNKQSSNYDYRSYYDPETLSLVYRLYHDDIELLGYKNKYETLRHFISVAYGKRTV